MNKEILSIFIGNNSSNLYGCENDAILFYNLNFLYPKYLLINDSVKITNLENIFKLNNNSKNVLIFFSGHGLKGGCFQFKDNILKPSELFILINKYFINPINLYIILDAISKASVGLFLFIFFLVNHFFLHQLSELELGDVLILQFAGILLLVDIDYKNVLKVIRKRFPKFLDTIYRT